MNVPESSDIRVRNDLPSVYSLRNKLARVLWGVVWTLLFRPTPPQLRGWRNFLLRLFGARLARTARVSSSVIIWGPWNLEMEESAEIGPHVDCYSVARIHIGAHATVSQYSYLCSGSRDASDPLFRPTKSPIIIEDQVWVAAGAFIGPGVKIGQGAVVGARSVVHGDVPPWSIYSGNPAQMVGRRTINDVLMNDLSKNDL